MFLRKAVKGNTLKGILRTKGTIESETPDASFLDPHLKQQDFPQPSNNETPTPSFSSIEKRRSTHKMKEFKIFVVGAAKVGKSNFVLQYVKSTEQSLFLVQGMYVSWKKKVNIEGENFMIDIHDTQEFDQYRANYLDEELLSAGGFVVLYNVNDENSFQEVSRIVSYIHRVRAPLKEERVSFVLCANFADTPEANRKVPTSEAKDLAISFEVPFFETVANDSSNTGAHEAFSEVIRDIYLSFKAKQEGLAKIPVTPLVKEARHSKQMAFRYSRLDSEEIKFAHKNDQDPSSDDTSRPPQIKAATLDKLIERLTYEKYPDPSLVLTFLLTYRSFTNPSTFLSLLDKRFSIEPPKGMSPKDIENWKKNVQTPIHLRVSNVIKYWVTHHFYDFENDPVLLKQLQEFVDKKINKSMTTFASQIQKSLKKRINGQTKEAKIMFTTKPPKSILPKNLAIGKFEFMDLDPTEVARQLTLIDSALFRAIKPQECLGQPWNRPGANQKAPNITSMITRFNQMSLFIQTEIIRIDKLKPRAIVLKRWIEVAKKCRELNNFNSIMIIIAALENSAIYRLKKTWKALPKKILQIYTELKSYINTKSNYKILRDAIHSANPPIIPYLGVYLSDLTFIEDGNSDYVFGDLINFDKRRFLANVITEIQQYQQTPYSLQEVPLIRDFLTSIRGMDDESIYRISLLIEPKESSSGPTKIQTLPSRKIGLPKDTEKSEKTNFETLSTKTTGKDLIELLKTWTSKFVTDEFRFDFLNSQAVEKLLENLIINKPPEDPTMVLKFFQETIVGDSEFHETIWNGIAILSRSKYPTEIKSGICSFLSLFKVQPIRVEVIDNHGIYQQHANEAKTKLEQLEQSEGVQSVELNKEKITQSNDLINWQIKTRKLINENFVAASGDRKCIFFETVKFLSLQGIIRKAKESDPSLPWGPVEKFLETFATQAKAIASEDDRFFKSSLFEASADVFESIEIHLKNIYDQINLLNRRLLTLHRVKQQQEQMAKLELSSSVPSIGKEVFSAYQADIEHVKELNKELDVAEVVTQTFIDDVFADKAIDSTFSKKEMQEATKLFQFIINIRSTQKEIEEIIPEIRAEKEEENISPTETVNEDD